MALIGWWKCDDTAGTNLTDSSGAGRSIAMTTTYTLGVPGISTDTSGTNKACDFTGGFGSITDATIQAVRSAWTVCAWINCDTFISSGTTGTFVFGQQFDGTRLPFGLIQNRDATWGAGRFGVGFYEGAWHEAYYATALTAATTYFLAGTFDGSTLKFYVDATLQATTTGLTPPAAASTGAMYAGRHWSAAPSATTSMDGRIDDMALWDVALSATDIALLHSDMANVPSVPTTATGRSFHVPAPLRRQAVIRASSY